MNKNAIILLSGGLDSVVSLAKEKNNFKTILAITFNYGQKAFLQEEKASKAISEFYKIEHRTISIDWLGKISNSTLNTNKSNPTILDYQLDSEEITTKSAQSVWVPNRNGLFINIAACYAEALDYDTIIIGANKEESKTFKDNSVDFINAINYSLKQSTNKEIEVKAPLIEMNKQQIINDAIKLDVPLNLIYSCYNNNNKHCGECESCQRLKRALFQNNRNDIIEKIFS